MVRLLNSEEIESLRGIFEKEFDSLPPTENANVIASVKDGRVEGFLVAETLLRFGMIYTDPATDKRRRPTILKEMAKFAYASVPAGSSVIIIAPAEQYGSLLRRLGMRELSDGEVFRKDF